MTEQKRVFFDLETGGLNPYRHPIIQIGAYEPTTGSEFQVKVKFDEKLCDAEALAMNHYDPDVWAAEALTPLQAAVQFSTYLRSHATVTQTSRRTGRKYKVAQLAGHNAEKFDLPFLRQWSKPIQGVFLPFAPKALCTKQLAMWLYPELESHSLGPLCELLGVKLDQAHDALADAKASAALADALMGAAMERGLV